MISARGSACLSCSRPGGALALRRHRGKIFIGQTWHIAHCVILRLVQQSASVGLFLPF
jgi:hypothetical protein